MRFVLDGRRQFAMWSTSIVRRFGFARGSALVLLTISLLSVAGGVVVLGQAPPGGPGPGPGPEPDHPIPRIEGFDYSWDGHQQYAIWGTVVDCDDVNDLEVKFGSVMRGITTRTDDDGNFFYLLQLPNGTGYEISATVTCREGLTSVEVIRTLL